MSKDKKNNRPEQISLEEFEKRKAKEARQKIKFSFPWQIACLLAIPVLLFIILLIGYLTYIKRFAPPAN